jgi:hypothetical protein
VFVASQLDVAGQMLRKSGRTLKNEWERLTGELWPAGCIAHHTCPLADGGADNGSNIEPMTPSEHVQHHKDRGISDAGEGVVSRSSSGNNRMRKSKGGLDLSNEKSC